MCGRHGAPSSQQVHTLPDSVTSILKGTGHILTLFISTLLYLQTLYSFYLFIPVYTL